MEKLRASFQGAYLRDFSLLKTERQRIEHLLKIEGLYENLEITPKSGLKCNQIATKYREKGNGEFKGKRYHRSAEFYTCAVFSAPVESEDCSFALALANRSASLFHMNHYQDCIRDIELALNNGYPKEMYFKLYERRGQCYWKLGKQDLAQDDWKLAMENVLAYPGKASDNIIKKLEISLSQNQTENKNKIFQDKSTIHGAGEYVNEMTSEAYSVQSSASKGRCVVASDNLKIGDNIICVKPYAAVLFDTSRLYRCWNCFSSCYCLLPCECCSIAGFCSSSCLESSKSFHQREELYLQSVTSSGLDRLAHLALRILLEAGYSLINSYSVSANGEIKEKSNKSLSQILDLTSNCEKRPLKTWVDMSLMSIYLLKHLANIGFFPEVPTEETKIATGTLILNILAILQCNAISVSEMEVKSEFSDCNPRDIGLGIYPKASMFNHSCNPSAEFNFTGKYCIVKALSNISKGREINCDYGPVYYLQSRENRRQALLANYMFECKCEACIHDWPLFENLQGNQPRFKCSACGKKMKNANLNKVKCMRCGNVENLTNVLNMLVTSFDRYSEVMRTVTTQNFQHVLPVLKQHMNLISTHLCLPWKDYASCQATLKQCFRLMGNTKISV